MKEKRLSQRDACFMVLFQAKGKYLSIGHFLGKRFIMPTKNIRGQSYPMSHKCSVRVGELYFDIEGISRQRVIGVTGARYYEYSYNHEFNKDLPNDLKYLVGLV